jgi:hypothetical protein
MISCSHPIKAETVPEKLKLSAIFDEKPVKLTVELPAFVHRDLVAYSEVFSRETGQSVDVARYAGAFHVYRPSLPESAPSEASDKVNVLSL